MRRSRAPLPRPRLTAVLVSARVGLVDAAGGYGKSTLVRLLGDELGIAVAIAELRPSDVDARGLIARLRMALRARGLSDLAGTLDDPTAEPAVLIEHLLGALGREPEPVLLAVDDAHHLRDADARDILERLASGVPGPHRLVVLGRHARGPLSSLAAGPDTVVLDAHDLAFSPAEVEMLLPDSSRAEPGAPSTDATVTAILRATGGWPAAVALLVDDATADARALLLQDVDRGALLGQLLEDRLGVLGRTRAGSVRQIALLPAITPDLVAEATGDAGLFDAMLDAGLPLAPAPGGWWRIPDPVRERLAAPRADGDVAVRAADALARRGDLEPAVRLLVTAGLPDRAAALLADMSPRAVERVDLRAMRGWMRAIPESALAAHPRAWLHLARACDAAADGTTRTEALERAAAAPATAADARLQRELDAERARDLARDGHADAAEALARGVADAAGADESLTRVRALHTIGRVQAWRADHASLAEAEVLLGDVVRLYQDLGMPGWSAHAALSLAYHVHHPRGEADAALARLDDALASLSGRQRLRAVLLTFKAEILIAGGRASEAGPAHDEARATGRALGDQRVLAYVAWNEARAASQAGDAARTLERLAEVDDHPGDWSVHPTGAEFLADAAVLSDRVGERASAAGYLARARARRTEADQAVVIAEAVIAARSGDPATAEAAFQALDGTTRLETRERWWLTLMRAWAAVRREDPAAHDQAREAFASAATIDPGLPFVREPEVAAALQARLAGSVPVHAPAIEVRLLGGADLWRAGRSVAVPPGRPAAILELVAVCGPIATEEVIEILWPELDPTTGRARLRNTLNRLRSAVGPVVVRRGEALELADGVTVDARRYERVAGDALAALGEVLAGGRTDGTPSLPPGRALDMGRAAIALYGGPLLPARPFDDWAIGVRARLHRLQVDLMDRLAGVAEHEGDLDEAIRMRRAGIALDGDDEVRHLALARLLLAQGRRGPARAALDAGEEALRGLGLPPTPDMLALRAAMGP